MVQELLLLLGGSLLGGPGALSVRREARALEAQARPPREARSLEVLVVGHPSLAAMLEPVAPAPAATAGMGELSTNSPTRAPVRTERNSG